MKTVVADKLTKKFGDFTAVDGVSFAVERGEIYGFLGANGAGKSTTIRMLCGLLEPTSGDAQLAGFSVTLNPDKVKKRLGYMSQRFSLYSSLTVAENLTFFAGVYGLGDRQIEARTAAVLQQVGLAGERNRVVSVLPGGVKQRVALACAIIHEPEIVFLDEPTAGVDPLLRRRFWDIIDCLSKAGTTVFVTTHYMDEVEHCHRIALMDKGRIIKEGSVASLKSSTFPNPLLAIETDDIVRAYEVVSARQNEIGEIAMHGATLHVSPFIAAHLAEQVIDALLREHRIAHGPASLVPPSMEDVFVKLVEGSI
jgi:ABC-2 type transport system ATP-binding protein